MLDFPICRSHYRTGTTASSHQIYCFYNIVVNCTYYTYCSKYVRYCSQEDVVVFFVLCVVAAARVTTREEEGKNEEDDEDEKKKRARKRHTETRPRQSEIPFLLKICAPTI